MIPTLPPVGPDDLRAAGGLAQVGPARGGPRPWTLREDGDDPTVFVVRGEPAPGRARQHDTAEDTADQERTLRMAGGAALLAMRLAVRLRGRRLHVHLLPDAHDPWALARLRVGSALAPTEAERTLGVALRPEQTAPTPPTAERVPPPTSLTARIQLRRAAEAERGWLVRLDPDPDPAPAPDPDRDPGLLVLGTVDDDPLAHLRAGQAVQRVLLTAAVHGLAAVVVSGPLASPAARAALRVRLGGGLWPHAVLRVADPT